MTEEHTQHEKGHIAQILVSVGYGVLTTIVAVQTLVTQTVDADLKVLFIASTTGLITWLVAKSTK